MNNERTEIKVRAINGMQKRYRLEVLVTAVLYEARAAAAPKPIQEPS
jgi:hypothetical protein